jgi:hypothetical protein
MDDSDDGVVVDDDPHNERRVGDVNGFEFPLLEGKDPGETILLEKKSARRSGSQIAAKKSHKIQDDVLG